MSQTKKPVPFVSGIELSRRTYWDLVRPILDRHFADLPHAAALIDSGSEVLGFDDVMSTDHHWGPRLLLFLEEEAFQAKAELISERMSRDLSYELLGYPTNFTDPDPEDGGVQLMQATDRGPVNHRIMLWTIPSFFEDAIGYDVDRPLEASDWLTLSEQFLRIITSGPIFYDGIGLGEVIARFSYYPRDVWLYMLAAGWARIGQEEHLMGRAGWAGDEVGSALIAARLVRDIMRLCFLMERTYAPYPKWFGMAFRQLECARDLMETLKAVLAAGTWRERDKLLSRAYEYLARRHNALGLTDPLPERVMDFHGRPFHSIEMHGFSGALLAQINAPDVRVLAGRPPIGHVDQFSDSTDLLSKISWRPFLRRLYQLAGSQTGDGHG